ncbi:MAG: phosphotransferase, partial [Candidatus Hadarchaeales archaeon]
LIIFPSLCAVDAVREKFFPHSPDIAIDGRAMVGLSAPEIVEIATSAGCLIGPAHAFTPWTSLYKEFNSLTDCYRDMRDRVSFLELGLSADSDMADRIAELQDITFLSCSDAHSPWPDKLGREFNRMELLEPTFEEVKMAILRKDGRHISLNVGFDPRLGKYHRTACSRCFTQYSLEKAKSLRWRCEKCGGWIKKGVWDRVNELASYPEPRHPPHRPEYFRVVPLAEIIGLSKGGIDPHEEEVQAIWRRLVARFGSEISVMVNASLEELKDVAGDSLAEIIKAFREGSLKVVAGGGGKYGHVELPGMPEVRGGIQKKLTEFWENEG